MSKTKGESLLHRLWRYINIIGRIADYTRASTLVVLLGGAALVFTSQGREVALGVVDSPLKGLFFVIAVTVWALQSWYWASFILDKIYGPRKKLGRFETWLKGAWPEGLGGLAFLTAAFVLFWAWYKAGAGNYLGLIFPALVLAIGAAFFKFWESHRGFLAKPFSSLKWEMKTAMTALSAGLIIVLVLWSFWDPVSLGFLVGPAVIFFALASIIPVVTWLVFLTFKEGFPVVKTIIIWAILLTFIPSGHKTEINDNHAVREFEFDPKDKPPADPKEKLPADSKEAYLAYRIDPAKRINFENALNNWLEKGNETKKDSYRPLVIVATSGGASRAAYWTVTVLGETQDLVPNFGNDLFAISSVSGGSLGATVFNAALKDKKDLGQECKDGDRKGPENTCFAALTKKVLSKDFLSPTLAAMLYQDLMQRFIPFSLFPDRAAALEQSWEQSWRKTIKTETFSGPFLALWDDPEGDNNWLPTLFLNGAHQETGKRIITSNIDLHPGNLSNQDKGIFIDAIDFYQQFGCNLRVSTATHNSARFPYVSPAGTIYCANAIPPKDKENISKGHILDGGYFENYGAITVREILDAAVIHVRERNEEIKKENEEIKKSNESRNEKRELKKEFKIQPIIIQITNNPTDKEESFENNEPNPDEAITWVNEVFAPPLGAFSARDGRGTQSAKNLRQWQTGYNNGRSADDPGRAQYFHFQLFEEKKKASIGMGWLLSEESMAEMTCQLKIEKQNGKVFNELLKVLGVQNPAGEQKTQCQPGEQE